MSGTVTGGWWWLILCAVSIYLVVWLILVVDVVDVSVVGLRPDLSGFWSTYLVLVGSTVPGDSHRQLVPATAQCPRTLALSWSRQTPPLDFNIYGRMI